MIVLIAIDGSPHSLHAVREAIRRLPLATCEVYIVSVAAPRGGISSAALPEDVRQQLVRQEIHEVRAALAEAQAVLQAAGINATLIVREGEAAGEILATARAIGPDLLVLGRHDRHGLDRLRFGSVSQAVVRHWHGSVLVVRPEPAA